MDRKPVSPKKRKKITPVYQPYLKGRAFCPLAVKRGFRLLLYVLVFMLVNLIIGTVLHFDNSPFLRYLMNTAHLAVYAMILYYQGTSVGEGDVAFAEIQLSHQQAGETIGEKELQRCYHPLKGFVTALCGVLIPLIVCLVYALMATRGSYTLQALPGWVSSFSSQEDFMAPLAYYSRSMPFTLQDGLRIAVRLMILPAYNMVGTRNLDGVLLLDRLSPLVLALVFFWYGVGYLMGRRARAMVHGGIAQARRRKSGSRKGLKKRAPKKNQPRELV